MEYTLESPIFVIRVLPFPITTAERVAAASCGASVKSSRICGSMSLSEDWTFSMFLSMFGFKFSNHSVSFATMWRLAFSPPNRPPTPSDTAKSLKSSFNGCFKIRTESSWLLLCFPTSCVAYIVFPSLYSECLIFICLPVKISSLHLFMVFSYTFVFFAFIFKVCNSLLILCFISSFDIFLADDVYFSSSFPVIVFVVPGV